MEQEVYEAIRSLTERIKKLENKELKDNPLEVDSLLVGINNIAIVSGDIRATRTIRAGRGLAVGNADYDPPQGVVRATDDIRAGGGIVSGADYIDPEQGCYEVVQRNQPPTPTGIIGRIYGTGLNGRTNLFLLGDDNHPRPMSLGQAAAAVRTTSQTIGNDVWTPIQFNNQQINNDGMINLAANNTRVTVQTPGIYIVSGQCAWSGSNPNGIRGLAVIDQSGAYIAVSVIPPTQFGAPTIMNVFDLSVPMSAGQYFTLQVYHNAGGNLNVDPFFTWQTLCAARVAGNA